MHETKNNLARMQVRVLNSDILLTKIFLQILNICKEPLITKSALNRVKNLVTIFQDLSRFIKNLSFPQISLTLFTHYQGILPKIVSRHPNTLYNPGDTRRQNNVAWTLLRRLFLDLKMTSLQRPYNVVLKLLVGKVYTG